MTPSATMLSSTAPTALPVDISCSCLMPIMFNTSAQIQNSPPTNGIQPNRKTGVLPYANAFIVFPGGFGTLDELFEVLTLVQTQHIKRRPIILIGTEYWDKLEGFIYDKLLENGAIKKKDLKLFTITDDISEVVATIDKFVEEKDRFKRKKFI